MKNGFTYKGIHSSVFGIVAKTKSRPVLPEMKSFTYDTPLTDGTYDFSEANEYGRAFYNDRFFEIQLQVSADNLHSLEKKVSKIAVWLKGSGVLVFDDMPLVKWNAKVISELGFIPELHGRKAVLTAAFRVKPFSSGIFDTINGPALNSHIELDTNMPIDISAGFIWNLEGGTGTYKAVVKNLEVLNIGNVHSRPVIRLVGDIKNVELSYGKKSLQINTSGSEFIIDCKKCIVYDSDNNSVMQNVSGEFFEIGEVSETIGISADIKDLAVVSVEYEPQFVYDFDFDDVDWGESNAQTI